MDDEKRRKFVIAEMKKIVNTKIANKNLLKSIHE
jgi:hypothetical protein